MTDATPAFDGTSHGLVPTSEAPGPAGSDRSRRIGDPVASALSDIIWLGTEDRVWLAAWVAEGLVSGWLVRGDGLVVALRDFSRAALDLDPDPRACRPDFMLRSGACGEFG